MPDGTERFAAAPHGRLQVGDWTVEPALNQLSAAGTTVKLEPKSMAALVYFADRPGQVVTRDALLSAIWPGVVVGDDSVTQIILKLRKALRDVRETPAYIQTIPKGGYRLIAPVVRSAEVVFPPLPAATESLGTAGKRRVRWMAGATISTLLVAAGVWWSHRGPAAGVAPDELRLASTVMPRMAQATITVRSFEALSDDRQELLLARGLTADLMTDLSKVSGLSVIGFSSPRAETLSDGLPIRYVVSGSVQRVDERLRLHVHLTDGETGKQLWSERFDRPLNGFFAIQEELGPRILHVLPAKVSEAELRRVAQRDTRNLEAYEYFQRGQAALRVRQRVDNDTAREMFLRAMGLDVAFARAYSGLALTYTAEHRHQWTTDGAAALDRALEIARTAHQMNRDSPETYWVLAYVHTVRREHEKALQYLQTAVRLYPSFADAYALMGMIKTHVGRPADAVPFVRTAMRLNPEGKHLYFFTLGQAYFFLGDLEQARLNLEHATSRNPAHIVTLVYMAALHVTAGNKPAAAWQAEEIRAQQPGFSSARWFETDPMTDLAQKTRLAAALRELGF